MRATSQSPDEPTPRGAGDLAVARILDAAIALFARLGTRRTTMNEVADRAGVGVATVYRRFPQKAELVRAAILHEAEGLIEETTAQLAAGGSLEDRATAGFSAFTHGLARRRLLREVIDGDPDVAAFLGGREGTASVIAMAREAIAVLLREEQEAERIPGFDPDIVAEILARLATSLALTPDGVIPLGDDKATRDFARVYLVPLLTANPH